MKYQVLFSLKNNEKVFINISSAAVVIGALRVKFQYRTKQEAECSAIIHVTILLDIIYTWT